MPEDTDERAGSDAAHAIGHAISDENWCTADYLTARLVQFLEARQKVAEARVELREAITRAATEEVVV